MKKVQSQIGIKYGRLLILEDYIMVGDRRNVRCKCDCGKDKIIFLGHIRNGHTLSCGCYSSELVSTRNTKHGLCKNGKNKIFLSTFNRIKYRCYNKNCDKYKDYGGRGITVSERWKHSFENFYNDMKDNWKPGLSIDRIDNNKGYCKENCKWSTKKEQSRNRRSNIIINGSCLVQYCEDNNIDHKQVRGYIYRHKKEGTLEHIVNNYKAKYLLPYLKEYEKQI